ncbi:MAG: class I SAM-dependent methyltransferase [Myxococcaceae bacterium]
MLTANDLLQRLVSLPPDARDAEYERLFEIITPKGPPIPPGEGMTGYVASHVPFIARALIEANVGAGDVFIDLGSGLGKVTTFARLCTDAQVRGIEYQAELIARCPKLDGVTYVHGDAREVPLLDGTVFFLYTPFTGDLRRAVFERLHEVARHHGITVCTVAFRADAEWLVERSEDPWFHVYESEVEGVAKRAPAPRAFDPRLRRIAYAEP